MIRRAIFCATFFCTLSDDGPTSRKAFFLLVQEQAKLYQTVEPLSQAARKIGVMMTHPDLISLSTKSENVLADTKLTIKPHRKGDEVPSI